jgi:hypothetical protein
MHSLTICFGPTATVWTLLFKEEERAKAAHAAILNVDTNGITLVDDFGQYVSLRREQVHGVMLENMDLSQQAQIERGLHQARSQAKAQDKAMADPVISQSLRRQQQGPAVLAPGGMPRMS